MTADEDEAWEPTTAPVHLPADSVGVWRRRADLGYLEHLDRLDPQSRERAMRLRRPMDRATFIAAHLLLNAVIADQLGVEPHRVLIDRTDDGRPVVESSSIEISLSHATPLVLVALSTGPCIGVDVEQLDQRRAAIETASVIGTKAEIAALSTSDDLDTQVPDFFDFWTAKEAWSKAAGTGLDDVLQQVTVWPAAGGPPVGWFLHRLHPWTDAAATLVVGGQATIHRFAR